MPRCRMMPPSWVKDERIADVQPLARWLRSGLYGIADREGRLEDRPRWIKAECLPYDDCDIVALLNELQRAGLIMRYVGSNGQRCIWIPDFADTQRPHVKELRSTLPEPPELITDLGSAEHLPSTDLGSAEHPSGSPVSKSESESDSESDTVSDSEPVSKSGSKTGTVSRSARRAGKEDGLARFVPKAIESAGQNPSPDVLIDTLLWYANQNGGKFTRQAAIRALEGRV